MLRVCNMLLVSIEKAIPIIRLNIDFSKDEVVSSLNVPLNSDGVQRMGKGRDYYGIESMFHSFFRLQTTMLDKHTMGSRRE